MDLIGIYRFHSITAKCTFFSSMHETFSERNCKIDHKARLNELKIIKMIPCRPSEHNEVLNVQLKKFLKIWKHFQTEKHACEWKKWREKQNSIEMNENDSITY